MCYTGKCPYEYGLNGNCCKWLDSSKENDTPPKDAWCYPEDTEDSVEEQLGVTYDEFCCAYFNDDEDELDF